LNHPNLCKHFRYVVWIGNSKNICAVHFIWLRAFGKRFRSSGQVF